MFWLLERALCCIALHSIAFPPFFSILSWLVLSYFVLFCLVLSFLIDIFVSTGDAASDLEAALTKALDEALMSSCFYNLGLCKVSRNAAAAILGVVAAIDS
jgi:hypothetical protein